MGTWKKPDDAKRERAANAVASVVSPLVLYVRRVVAPSQRHRCPHPAKDTRSTVVGSTPTTATTISLSFGGIQKFDRKTSSVRLSENMESTPAELVPVVKKFRFEGILAKRPGSLYESGKRSGAWQKYRVNKGQECVIGGYVPNNPIDSIIVGYYNGDQLLYAAKVRNCFVPNTRCEVFAQLRGLRIDTCPFVNLPEKKRTTYSLTKEEMKKCIWLKPELVAQIEFAEWTRDNHTCAIRNSSACGTTKMPAPSVAPNNCQQTTTLMRAALGG